MSDLTGEPRDDDAPIGAAATIPLKGTGRERKSRRERTGKRRFGGAKLIVLGLVVVMALAFLPVLRGAFAKTPKDRIGVSYGGGPIEGNHFQRIVEPGSGLFFNGIFDNLYLYPADQRSYIISAGPESTAGTGDAVVAPTSDRVLVSYQVALYYKLNTNPAELRRFHEELGLRYSAYTGKGWAQLIQETFQPQVESAIQEETRRTTVADLFGDADQLQAVQQAVQVKLSERLEQSLGSRFFCGPSFHTGEECSDVAFVIKRVDVPDSVSAAFEANKTSAIAVVTKENEVLQREQEAKAISALGLTGDQYTTLKAIESGQINFWVLPKDSGVTLQAPDTAGAAAGGG